VRPPDSPRPKFGEAPRLAKFKEYRGWAMRRAFARWSWQSNTVAIKAGQSNMEHCGLLTGRSIKVQVSETIDFRCRAAKAAKELID